MSPRQRSGLAGQFVNYYSPRDPVLAGPMKVFGTIDGKFGEDGAGSVGFRTPGVVNIRWEPEFARHGYHGGHTDSTSAGFVKSYLSKHIIHEVAAGELPGETLASSTE